MHSSVVALLNIVDFEHTILVYVDLLESLYANVGAELVHWTDHATNKLIEVDFVVAVHVKDLEESRDILLVDLNAEVVDSLSELVLVKGA
jgi:hypothetical protein